MKTESLERFGAILTIDLDAIADNYNLLCHWRGGVNCAAAVKADAYGLGVELVAPVLAEAGCSTFFVATIDEGIELRGILPEAEILVLNGLLPGTRAEFRMYGLIPVLNDLGQVADWAGQKTPGPAALHVDTGMNRLGLSRGELETLIDEPERLAGIPLVLIMSHLACGDEPESPMNANQLETFEAARARLPEAPASIANSAGVFLGPAYHLDLARPGIALYGGLPHPAASDLLSQVVHLKGRILQVRDVDSPQTVGYGASHAFPGPARVATVSVGYADGYLRSLGNSGSAWFGGLRAPVVGRVSMDLITLDVSAIPPHLCQPGDFADLIGGGQTVDDVARAAGTISYEILTALGGRYKRVYVGGGDAVPAQELDD